MLKTKRNILVVEIADNILKNIPECLQNELDRLEKNGECNKLTHYNKMVYSHKYNNEYELCKQLRIEYREAPKHKSFVFSYQKKGLEPRPEKVKKLYDLVSNNRVSSLCGFGGSGKTSLVNLFAKNYASKFNQIAYIVVNNSIKEDFISKINDTIQILKPKDNSAKSVDKVMDFNRNDELPQEKDDRYASIIKYLETYYQSDKPNLLIIDINKATDQESAKFGDDLVNLVETGTKIYPDGWKYLIVSRENIYAGITSELNLNENEESDPENAKVLKSIFLKNAGSEKYKDFGDENFSKLFQKIYYSPLMTEQLGIYLKKLDTCSLSEIFAVLETDNFNKKDRIGMTSKNRYREEEKSIIGFLRNIFRFDKLKVEEQLLLKHFILWPTDYIPEDVIKQLLNRKFESEANRLSKLWSIIKYYFDFSDMGGNRVGAFYNKVKRYKVSKIWCYLIFGLVFVFMGSAVLLNEIGVTIPLVFSYPYSVMGVWGVLVYLYIELTSYNCTFRPLKHNLLRVFLGGVYGFLIDCCFSERSVIGCIMAMLSGIFIPSFSFFMKKVIKCLFSNRYLDRSDNKNIKDALSALVQRGIVSQKNIDNQKCYKLHGLIADSIRCQIDIPHTDYIDYLHGFRKCNGEDKNLESFLQCVGQSLCECGTIDMKFIMFQVAYTLSELFPNIAASLYSKLIVELGGCFSTYCKSALAKAYENLASVQSEQLRDYDSALKNYNHAIVIKKQLPQRKHYYRYGLALSYWNLAVLQKNKLQDYSAAFESFSKSLDILIKLPEKKLEYQNRLAGAYMALADIMRSDRYSSPDYVSAQEYYVNAIGIFGKIASNGSEYQNNLAIAYEQFAVLQFDNFHNYTSATKYIRDAIDICKTLPKDEPVYVNALICAYNRLAIFLDKQNKYDEAIKAITPAIDIAANWKEKVSEFIIAWLRLRYSYAEIKFNNDKDLEEVKSILVDDIKPLVLRCLNDNSDDDSAKKLSDDIDNLMTKIEGREK